MFNNDKLEITVTCASGIEKVLKSELFRLGYGDIPADNGSFKFYGSGLDVARANINLRTADRVYLTLAKFKAESFDQLFDGVKGIEFENFITKTAKIVVDGKCVKSKIYAVSASQSVIKKAIVERLKSKFGVNSLEESGEKYEIDFSIYKDVAEIRLNTSGEGLHKRGYRDLVGIAPIKETLASGLILLSDFYYKNPFLDPFCGSGTIPIECAKIALDMPPNLNRKFAFNGWKNFDGRFYKTAIEEGRDKIKLDRKVEIFGSDIDPKAVKLSNYHAERAGVKDYVKFGVRSVKDVKLEFPFGTVVTNPPYGERVYDKDEASDCYKNLGKVILNSNWSAFVITSAKFFEKSFGKRADRVRKLYNSQKECNFYYYYGKKEKNND